MIVGRQARPASPQISVSAALEQAIWARKDERLDELIRHSEENGDIARVGVGHQISVIILVEIPLTVEAVRDSYRQAKRFPRN
jgi:hypothetical protein